MGHPTDIGRMPTGDLILFSFLGQQDVVSQTGTVSLAGLPVGNHILSHFPFLHLHHLLSLRAEGLSYPLEAANEQRA